ncbi:hypothetical protein ATO6_15825 [Oceanicola sp. 22II-s10i]|uniref:hypothetical protein n=1 Tax=Oceanicola sp. 22II-s10i TaxID=1317116 RepID=UPI000B51FD52|nr:hypothetical protein [Oceanicola sp. 22II-s10i]OWU83885.1 hypothetical protein ATO6_15825 [Oceanicola sp. 22II-s10i]
MLTIIRISAVAAAMTLPAVAQAQCLINAGNARCVSADSRNVGSTSLFNGPGGFSRTQTTASAPADTSRPREISSARFVTAPVRTGPAYVSAYGPRDIPVPAIATYAPGETLPENVSILFNRDRHGLPAPRDGWTYFRLGNEIFRADLQSRKVIDRVNDHMSVRF